MDEAVSEIVVRGWMTEDERQFLKRLAFGKRVLELGSYEGLSTISMAQTARHITAVDTFDGRATASQADTLQTFVKNLDATGLLRKVHIRQGTTAEVLPMLAEEGEKYDLIFIDADHSYEAVTQDIVLSMPLLATGGVMAFHDYDQNHGGVVTAVNEMLEEGAHPLEQQNSLIALSLVKPSEEAKKPVVYLVMPHRDLQCNLGAAAGLHFASNNKLRQVVSNYGTSVLTQCFNHLLAEALTARNTDGVTHFAMLHNDVIPCRYWLDILMEELNAGDYDMVSAVIPLKNPKGLTSTGLGTDSLWNVRRLTMTEIYDLPETFSAKDVSYRPVDNGQLLLNTGCWLMRLDQPWVEGLCFRQQDMIAWSIIDQKYVAQSISEDWDFTRQLLGRGCRVAATRKVPIIHERPEFHNRAPWGEWKTDEEYFRTEKAITEYRSAKQAA